MACIFVHWVSGVADSGILMGIDYPYSMPAWVTRGSRP